VVNVDAQFDHDALYSTRFVNEFHQKLAQLRNDLVTQGRRVNELALKSVESFFDRNAVVADKIIADDDLIDRVNVQIERAAVPLLAMGETDEHEIRSVLTIVKINNELERIADCAVNIAETVRDFGEHTEQVPPTFRVMANSVLGMLRDAIRALEELNTGLAEQVLAFDDTVDKFKFEIILDAEKQVATGTFGAQFAFRLLNVTKNLERIADHCTNVCEQVIYVESGLVVRHQPDGWTKPAPPEL
jgi:phosphate transport system protein